MRLLEFRFDFVVSITLTGINVLFYAFLWSSVFADETTIEGVTRQQMIIYSVVSNFITVVFTVNVQSYINDSVKTGNIAYILSKPLNVCIFWLSSDIGCLLNKLIIYLVPIGTVIIYIIINEIPIHAVNVILFILSCIFSYLILWAISFCVGSIAFWHNDLGTVGNFKDLIILILSGSFVPLWFFPELVQKISEFLPFQYIYQAPLGILINKYSGYEAVRIILVQVIWTFIFIFATGVVYKKGKNKLVVQGG